ncbi:PorV/PorQ family protein [Hoylesella loescheii]|uniref:PorV/PorQ family protein n=1 Tax=Hoylesella loescheii TaxID=840 RepID=UPI0028E76486|nr:PorV/PorQ family protein [Hoylesella loescheii]
MNSKHIIIACVALLCTMQARAQGQDLSVLAANPDARTAAMGNAAVAADGMYLYNNPSAFLCANKKFSADASASIYEKTEGYEGTFGLYTAAMGYKFANRHAAFAGFRYAGGLKLKGYDMFGEPTKDYQPYNWTIDLGYAYMIGNGFSAYAVGNVIFSHLSKNAVGGAFTIGASYQKSTTIAGNKSANLMLDAKVGAIGPQLDYGNGNKTTMPTYVAVGGALTVDVADKHQVGGAWSTRYFFRPSEYKTLMLGAGLEYTYNKMVSLRAGYEYGDRNLSHFTMGAGFKYGGLHLNGAYMLKTVNAGSSYCTIGLGYDF